jgi:DNA-directed RNA polymerase specialized sigma24 family protein
MTLCVAESVEPILRDIRLPGRITPRPMESLASWLLRYAAPFGLAPTELFFGSREIRVLRDDTWWLRPHPVLVEAISKATGLSIAQIGAMTFPNGQHAVLDDLARRFSRTRYYAAPMAREARRQTAVCPHCLASDRVPYYRRDWTAGWVAVCSVHRAALIDRCPKCRRRIELPPLHRRGVFRPTHCLHCSFSLGQAHCRDAHPIALDLQEGLLAARLSGRFTLPDQKSVDWPLALVLFSVLLAVVWFDAKPARYHWVVSQIEADLRSECVSGLRGDNYHGLLLLAWMLSGWPETTRQMAESAGSTLARLSNDSSQDTNAVLRRRVMGEILSPLLLPTASGPVIERPEGDRHRSPSKSNLDPKVDYPATRARLISWAVDKGEPYSSAEDFAQEILLRVFESDSHVRNGRAFAVIAARNLFIDQVRRRRAWRSILTAIETLYGESQDHRDSFRVVSAQEEIRRLEDRLHRMPRLQRNAWLSKRVNGDPLRGIAYEAGVTLKAVEKALRLADHQLEEAFPESLRLRGS